MNDVHYRVATEVFAKYPGYVRGILLAYGLANGASPEELVSELRAAEEGLRQRLALAGLAEHPRIRSWREAFRAFGAKPGDFRSSIEAMTRRALRGDPLPSINALVDIGNIMSLRYLVPAGAHAIDEVTEDLALRPADGTEDFVALGSEVVEHPEPGEIIFAEGNTVLTRRWTWRQGHATLTRLDSTAVEYNVDGLPPVTAAEVLDICQAISGLVQHYCGGRSRIELLSAANPCISITE
jgi:DNA/RNA-binding domain of Phe-tRNA-synthetase-like protein